MRIRLAAAAIVLALLLAPLGGRGGSAEPPLVPAALHLRAAAGGTVRVIVRLNAPFRPEAQLATPAHVTSQRQMLGGLHATVRHQLRGVPHRVARDFGGTLPLMAIEASPDALRMLESLRGIVVDVQEDVADPPALADSVPLINADEVWNLGADGTGQIVAILDTGVQKSHPFLGGRVIAEACFSSTAAGGTSVCPGGVETSFAPGSAAPCTGGGTSCNHGTHVAGIAAGSGASFSGVARGAEIIAIQVFSRFTSTANCGAGRAPCALSFTSDQIEALSYVNAQRQIFNGRRIAAVNMSLGGGSFTSVCSNDPRAIAIDQLRAPNAFDPSDPGVATVISSGNDGFTTAIAAPACNSGAVPVASSTKSDGLSFFSNIASTGLFPSLLIAPGSTITSSYPPSTFAVLSGTSMAAPHVTGTFAVLREIAPTRTVDQLLATLKATGHPITDIRVPGGATAPRIDVLAAALQLPVNLRVDTLTAPPTALSGANVSVSVSIRNTSIVPTGASTLKLYLSTSTTILTSDTLLDTVAFPALAAGETSAVVTRTFPIPAATLPGAYFVGAIADADNQNTESSETDNTRAVAIQVVRPDLAVAAVTFTPATSGPGLNVSVTHTVSNLAASPAGAPATISSIYLGRNQSFGSVLGGPIGTVNVPPVAAGATTPPLTTSVVIPAGVPLGPYSILVRANDPAAFVESGSAANNVTASATQIVLGPDLIVTAASTAASIATGANVSVTFTVKNQGGQAAGPFEVGFALAPQPSGADRAVGPSRAVPGLAAGAAATFTSVVSIPTATPPAGYKLKVVADAGSAIPEADEGNNTGLTGVVNVVQSDLTIGSVTFAPAAIAPGGNVTVTHTVKNLAPAPGSAAGTLSRIRLTPDQTVVAPEVLDVGQVIVPPVAAGGVASVTKVIQIPASAPPGRYYVAVTADGGGTVFEVHEDNNTAFSLTRVIVGPDPLPTAASLPAAVAVGTNASIRYTIKNQGGAAVPAGGQVIFTLLPQPSGSPLELSQNVVLPGLAPGALLTQTSAVPIPPSVSAGPYKVSVTIQTTGDADTGNNTILTALLNVVTPDLAMQSVTFSPAAVAPGGNVTVVQTIRNLAPAPGSAVASRSRLFLSLNQSAAVSAGELGPVDVPAIAAGATVAIRAPIVIPAGTPPGLYHVAARANNTTWVPETRLDNNLGASVTRLIVGADIVPTAATTVAAIAPGRNLSVSYTLKNPGGAATGAFDVDFALVPVNASGAPIGGDIPLGTRPVASILPGRVLPQAATVVVPNVSGPHRVRIVADPGNAVVEADEANNTLSTSANLNVGAPDLVVPPFTFSPAVSAPGGTVTVLSPVKNQAPAPGDAGASTSRLLLSLNQSALGEVVSLGTASVPPIAAGLTVSASRPITLPGNLSAGYYYFGLVADAAGQVFESSESNNITFTQARILVGPDILPTAATTTAATTPGSNVSVTHTLRNQGGQAASNFSVSFRLVPVTAAGAPAGADIPLAPTRTGVTLGAGITQPATSVVAIPDVPTPGLYRIRVVADSASAVAEADESNNTLLTTGVISIVRPDLSVQSVTATPAVATTGTSLVVSHVVKNLATPPGTAGPTTTRFRLSPAPGGPSGGAAAGDPEPPAVDPSIDVAVPAIPAGGTVTVGGTMIVPALAPGKYVVVAQANALNTIVEADSPTQANDVRSTSTTILIGPDLTVTAVTAAPAALAPGANVSVTNSVKNQGGAAAGPFDVGFYLSPSNVFDGSAVLLATRRVTSLAAGATSAVSTPVRIPGNQSSGSVFVLVRADSAGETIEADETNNVKATAAAIAVIRPDLVVLSVTATPAVVAPGRNISVTHTVKNISPAAGVATATTSRLYLSPSSSPVITTQPILGDVPVPVLGGGAMVAVARSVQVPPGTAPGKYWIIAVANATGTVVEESTPNGQVTTAPIIVGPDLLMTALTNPLLVSPNLTFPVTTTVKNQGGQGTNGSVVRFFLSLSGVLDGSQVPLGVTSTAALAPGAASTTMSRLTIPGNTSSGGRFLLTQVDGGDPEADLTNNVRLGSFNIEPPQLQVVSVTAPAAAVLGRVTGAPAVSVVIKNVGTAPLTGPAAPFEVRVYASRDDGTPAAQVPGAGDLILSKTVLALVPGATTTVTGPLIVPAVVGGTARQPGSYFVSATADPTGTATGDQTLGDNTRLAPRTVTVTAP